MGQLYTTAIEIMKQQEIKAFIAILGIKVRKDKTQLTVSVKRFVKKLENISDDEAQEILEEKNYVAALGICTQGISRGKPNTAVTSGDSCSFKVVQC